MGYHAQVAREGIKFGGILWAVAVAALGCGNNWEHYAPAKASSAEGGSGPSTSTGTSSTSGGPSDCGFYNALSENFSGATWLPALTEQSNDGTAFVKDNRLRLENSKPLSFDTWTAMLKSRYRYSLLGQRISVEVLALDRDTILDFGVLGDDGSTSVFVVRKDDDDRIGTYTSNGNHQQLNCGADYSSTAHRWWAIDVPSSQAADAELQVLSSPDGTEWSPLCSYPMAWLPRLDRAIVAVRASGNGFADGARIDNFNNAPTRGPLGSLCPPSALSHDFNDGLLARHWLPEAYNRHQETGGVLHLFMREESSPTPVALDSDRAYDMSGHPRRGIARRPRQRPHPPPHWGQRRELRQVRRLRGKTAA